MKQEHINEIKAIVILAIGMILLASLISYDPKDVAFFTFPPNVPVKNFISITGAYMAGAFLFIIGYSAYLLVAFLFYWSWNKFSSRRIVFNRWKFIASVILFCVLSALFSMIGNQEPMVRFNRSGFIGILLADFLVTYLKTGGAFIVLITLALLCLIVAGEFLVLPLFQRLMETAKVGWIMFQERQKKGQPTSKAFVLLKPKINVGQALSSKREISGKELTKETGKRFADELDIEDEMAQEEKISSRDGKPKIIIMPLTNSRRNIKAPPEDVGEYHLPSLDLLEDPPNVRTSEIESSLVSGAKLLENTLLNFGVNARVVDIERGPAITRYELEPAPGVKVQKFTTLQDDIALAMRAATVRIVAPIPGKNRVGIEVPNSVSAAVYLKEVLTGEKFLQAKTKLALALGKDIAGEALVADLTQMPHLLIAGTTGSGKTVCVNSLIMSILFRATPDEVKFVMVDPKMVELSQYNDLPHLLCPVVTDVRKASAVLNWVVGEMENRYRRLSKEGVRNIQGYNAKGLQMPYIVVIIDELADLMQVAAKGVEGSIARLAQLSRSVGIHLILATQRPSVNVVTGVIKANFPARISFKVASKVDSRTVLDMNGAETLLGKGDLLFMEPGEAKPRRGQGNFVRDEEIARVITFIKEQRQPQYDESVLSQQKGSGIGEMGEKDECYDEALRLVIETNQASVSILQRRMRLGYTRAARLIDMMEQDGIEGPYLGSKPREIIIDREQWLLQHANTEAKQEQGNESSGS